MRKWLLVPILAASLQAAVIRGTVVENSTGQPLSRASVILEPVPGSGGTRMTGHTNRFGFFEFAGEPAGSYLLQASRISFVTAQYGQKRWNSSGMPLAITENETQFVTLRLLHFGSIVGTVVDENDIGMPEFEVAAYLNTHPPQLVTKATTDDRGRYRIYGLLPGNYVVRTLGKQVDEVGYVPTFGRETELLDQARAVDVEIERQSDIGSLRPIPGKLFTLNASASAVDPCPVPSITMTLASEMGRQIIHAEGCAVARIFPGLPPGDYELIGEAPTDMPPTLQGDYQRLSLGKDMVASLTLRKIPLVTFQFEGVSMQAAKDGTVKVLARRKDLAGTYDTRVLTGSNAALAPGRWELALYPLDGYYASSFSGPGMFYRRRDRPEGWNEITVSARSNQVRFGISANVSTVHGLVKDAGNPVVGAPVFLEPIDIEPEKRLAFAYTAITDVKGQYKFSSVPPGHYRVLSTFEYQMPDGKIMEEAGPSVGSVSVDSRSDASRDVDLYIIR